MGCIEYQEPDSLLALGREYFEPLGPPITVELDTEYPENRGRRLTLAMYKGSLERPVFAAYVDFDTEYPEHLAVYLTQERGKEYPENQEFVVIVVLGRVNPASQEFPAFGVLCKEYLERRGLVEC